MIPSPHFPISVIGAGSMGLLWAGYLAHEGWDVELICKLSPGRNSQGIIQVVPPNQPQFKTSVSITENAPSPTKSRHLNKKMMANTVYNREDKSSISVLLVAVKAYQVVDAISSILDRLSNQTHIILIQNGMGSDLELLNQYPSIQPHQLIYAITTHGAMNLSSAEKTGDRDIFRVKHTGLGVTWLGRKHAVGMPNSKSLDKLLQIPLINGWVEDIERRLWQKLFVNAIINPLTALLDCKNGQLILIEAQNLWLSLLKESIAIAKAQGHNFDFDTEKNRVLEVAQKTSMNYSSMHQDIKYHRTTEILYINGFLVQQAKMAYEVCPMNQLLLAMIEMAQMKRQ